MRVFQIEIIIRTVEIGWHERYKVGSVLFVIGLASDDAGDFRHGVSLIGGFKGAGHEIFFLDGLRREAGIDAGTAEKYQFFNAAFFGVFQNISLHHEVFVDKLPGVSFIGHNTAHFRGSQKYILGFFFFKKTGDSSLVEKVKFFSGFKNQI